MKVALVILIKPSNTLIGYWLSVTVDCWVEDARVCFWWWDGWFLYLNIILPLLYLNTTTCYIWTLPPALFKQLQVINKHDPMAFHLIQHGRIDSVSDAVQVHLGEISQTEPIFRWASLDMQIFNSNGQNNERGTVNSKYNREHKCTYNVLMFTCLTTSKSIYLLMDCELFSFAC